MGDSMFREDTAGDDEYDYLIKLFAIGDSSVGKTCFLNRYVNNKFNPRFSTTVGVDFHQKRVIRESRDSEGLLGPKQRIHLQLWDTAGQERYRSLCTALFRDSMGFLLMFDLTNEQSMLNCHQWMELLCHHAYCDKPDVILVGNKSDLTAERQVPFSSATALAREFDVPYIETSAATGSQVSAAVDKLLDAVMQRIEDSVTRPRVEGLPPSKVDLNATSNKSKCAC